MNGIVLPKTYIEMPPIPFIYLMGPIQGAPAWHDEAISFLFSRRNNLTVITPKKELRADFQNFVLPGDPSYFDRQRAWERYYMGLASTDGALLCWLPGEVNHKCEKAYGAMTRFELGQISQSAYLETPRFVLGTDGKFSEFDIIAYDLSQDFSGIRIYDTLEETCLEALELIQ